VLLKITVEQNGVILSQSIVEIDDDESLSVAIKSAVDTVRAQDPSKPLWGLGIKVDKLAYGRRQSSTSPDLKLKSMVRNRNQDHDPPGAPAGRPGSIALTTDVHLRRLKAVRSSMAE
jgi:hypothetical protein